MRRSLIALGVLVLLALGSIGAVAAGLWTLRDDIDVQETVLYGDRDGALGLSITERTFVDYHLFWDTTYTLRPGGLEVETDYRFSAARDDVRGPNKDRFWLNVPTNVSMSGSIELESMSMGRASELPITLLLDVASRAPAGQVWEEVVSLADYYDDYPLSLECWDDSGRGVVLGWDGRGLPQALRIPVPQTHLVRVKVEKDPDGQITAVECNDVQEEMGLGVDGDGVVLADGAYFALGTEQTELSLPDQLYGIHRVPLEEERITILDPAETQIQRVFPLTKEDGTVLCLTDHRDEEELLLLTRRAEEMTLWSIRRETMALEQKVSLPIGREVWLAEMDLYDDFLVVRLMDGTFYVLTGEMGQYEVALEGDLSTVPILDKDRLRRSFYEAVAMDYDGERLAVVLSPGDRYAVGEVYLMTFDQTGLSFLGGYVHSGTKMGGGMTQVSGGELRTVSLPE